MLIHKMSSALTFLADKKDTHVTLVRDRLRVVGCRFEHVIITRQLIRSSY